MNLKELAFRFHPTRFRPTRFFANIFRNKDEDPPIISMVLLLRQPHYFDAEELRLAAERAWGTSFRGGEGSRKFVVQSGGVTLLRAGPHFLSLLHCSEPYFSEESGSFAKLLPQPSQQKAWMEHLAWTAVDYVKCGADVELEYCVLAKLVAEMLDVNCTGVYAPAEKSIIPNGPSLYTELQTVAASRDPGVV